MTTYRKHIYTYDKIVHIIRIHKNYNLYINLYIKMPNLLIILISYQIYTYNYIIL